MGKKEKLYESTKEHRINSLSRSGGGTAGPQRRLPFRHCALTLQPYTEAVCNPANPSILYDNAAILPFVWKWKRDPCTGTPLTSSQLVRLNMDRNEEGDWQCPILTKTLADHTKIVAIIQPPQPTTSSASSASQQQRTANVYSFVAYKQLNVQAKNYTDLLSGEPFDPVLDVLFLRDPEGPPPLAIEEFYYIRHADEFPRDDDAADIRHSATSNRVLAQLEKKKEKAATQLAAKRKAASSSLSSKTATTIHTNMIGDGPFVSTLGHVILVQDVTGVALTTSAGAASFTSTGMDLATQNAARPATAAEILQGQCDMLKSLREKAHVRLTLRYANPKRDDDDGDNEEPFVSRDLVAEIHCDRAPRTATNFLGLAEAGRYNGTSFHRLIPNFMMQGGKASSKKKHTKKADETSSTVSGGKEEQQEDASLWGGAFADEFHERIKHDARGVLAMANAGPHTNKQQFYITFAPCAHLDGKHSVFGKVVQGLEVLDEVEKIGKDARDRPLEKITIAKVEILANPIPKAHEKEAKRIAKLQQARLVKEGQYVDGPATKKMKSNFNNPTAVEDGTTEKDEVSTVGKYLKNRLAATPTGSAAKASSGSSIGGSSTLRTSTLKMEAAQTKAAPAKTKKTKFGNFSGW